MHTSLSHKISFPQLNRVGAISDVLCILDANNQLGTPDSNAFIKNKLDQAERLGDACCSPASSGCPDYGQSARPYTEHRKMNFRKSLFVSLDVAVKYSGLNSCRKRRCLKSLCPVRIPRKTAGQTRVYHVNARVSTGLSLLFASRFGFFNGPETTRYPLLYCRSW